MPLNLPKVVIQYLKQQPEQKFTAREIAEWVCATYPTECQQKKSSSKGGYLKTDGDLVQQIAAEIGARHLLLQKSQPELKTIEERPRKYYFSLLSDSEEVDAAENPILDANLVTTDGSDSAKWTEHALYPLLSQYLIEALQVYSKRINEKCSTNKLGPKANHWLHPDLVGMQALSESWRPEVQDCVKQYFGKLAKLWSFEVKLLINSSNVRECFFQAVSNSSWANSGYLVAKDIEGDHTIKELRMLAAAHGIGLIKLDANDPYESQILIPARERSDIDWDAANRLAVVNSDFMNYLKLVKQFYQTCEAKPKDWD